MCSILVRISAHFVNCSFKQILISNFLALFEACVAYMNIQVNLVSLYSHMCAFCSAFPHLYTHIFFLQIYEQIKSSCFNNKKIEIE